MLMTISSSLAPSKMARRASKDFVSGEFAPSGKPITVHTFTPLPRRAQAASRTQVGFMHTEANPYRAPSSHIVIISSRVASGFNNV
jgi:hypothetical protein